MFSRIWNAIKELIKKMIGAKTIERTLHVAPVLSTQMEQAIELWSAMYKNEAPWLHEPSNQDPTRVVSLGLPALIASEKARMAILEMQSEIPLRWKRMKLIIQNMILLHRLIHLEMCYHQLNLKLLLRRYL